MKKLLGVLMVGILILTACGQKEVALTDIVKGFKDARLTADNGRKMERDDFGLAPMKAENAYIFEVGESYDEAINGRLFQFDDEDDLNQTKKYYDNLGEESATLYSHTFKSEDGKYLMQMNGDIDDETFNKYKDTMNKVIKGEKVDKVASVKKDDKTKTNEDDEVNEELAYTNESESTEESGNTELFKSDDKQNLVADSETVNVTPTTQENKSNANVSNSTSPVEISNVSDDIANDLPTQGIGGHPSLYNPSIAPPSPDNLRTDENGDVYYDATLE